jgi:hypothetical protein
MEMICRLGKLILITGWVLPFWLSGSTLLEYLRVEITPRLAGVQPLNSFPYIDFSSRSFTVGCVWMAVAVGYHVMASGSGKPKI